MEIPNKNLIALHHRKNKRIKEADKTQIENAKKISYFIYIDTKNKNKAMNTLWLGKWTATSKIRESNLISIKLENNLGVISWWKEQPRSCIMYIQARKYVPQEAYFVILSYLPSVTYKYLSGMHLPHTGNRSTFRDK